MKSQIKKKRDDVNKKIVYTKSFLVYAFLG